MNHATHGRRLAALVVAVGLGFAGCSRVPNNASDGVPVPDQINTSAISVQAADFGLRPPDGGPRPGADVNTSVAAAHATKPWSIESASVEQEFVDATDLNRRQVRAPALIRDATLDAYARDHAAAMSAVSRIYHSNIGILLNVWWFIGENVGVGPDAGRIQAAYRASPGHLENLTNPTFTHFGVGVFIDIANRVWTVQDFAA